MLLVLLLQEHRRILEAFVFQQFLNQLVARIGQLIGGAGAVGLSLDRGLGQQQRRFDLHQRGRHHQEIAGQVDIQPLLAAHLLEHAHVN